MQEKGKKRTNKYQLNIINEFDVDFSFCWLNLVVSWNSPLQRIPAHYKIINEILKW